MRVKYCAELLLYDTSEREIGPSKVDHDQKQIMFKLTKTEKYT